MKRHTLISASLLAAAVAMGAAPAGADRQRSFGFTGKVDSFNRGAGALVVGDALYHISESTLVYNRRGAKGTLSDLTPGTKIGFYPGTGTASYLSEIWVLPRNWHGKLGMAETADD